MDRFVIKERENSPFFPFAAYDTVEQKQVFWYTRRDRAERAVKRLNTDPLA